MVSLTVTDLNNKDVKLKMEVYQSDEADRQEQQESAMRPVSPGKAETGLKMAAGWAVQCPAIRLRGPVVRGIMTGKSG